MTSIASSRVLVLQKICSGESAFVPLGLLTYPQSWVALVVRKSG